MVGGGPPPGLAARRRRPRLSARLDAVLAPTTRLTVVAAPPGYGKSVAVAGWIADRGIPVAWVDLDATARDPARLARLAVAALADARPAASSLVPAIALGTTPDPIALGDLLLDAIATDDTDLVVVFDDCHLADSPDAMAVLRRLVGRMPPFAHLVLVGREEPGDPPGASARAAVSWRSARPTFASAPTKGEAPPRCRSHRARGVGRRPCRSDGGVGGGPPAHVPISVARDGGAVAAADTVSGTNRYLIDYLGDEVMAGLDADLGEVLAAAAVAGTFSPALVGAMAGRDDADALVERAERANLFVVPLDSERRWYRMHGLFADYLRSRIAAAEQRRLHAAAAAWLEAEGLGRDALTHALEADEPDHAARPRRPRGSRRARGRRAPDAAGLDRAPAAGRSASRPGRSRGSRPGGGSTRATSPGLPRSRRGPAPVRATVLGCHRPRSCWSCARSSARPSIRPPSRSRGRGSPSSARTTSSARSVSRRPALRSSAHGDVPGSLQTLRAAFDAAEASDHPIAVLPAVNPLGHALIASGRRDEAEAVARRVLAAFPGLQGEPLAVAWPHASPWASPSSKAAIPRVRREAARAWPGRCVVPWRRQGGPRLGRAGDRDGPPGHRVTPRRLRDPRARTGPVARVSLAGGGDAHPPRPCPRRHCRSLAVGGRRPPRSPRRLTDGRIPRRLRCPDRGPRPACRGRPTVRCTGGRRVRPGVLRASGSVPDLISCDLLAATGALGAGDRATARASLASAVRLATPGGYVRRFVDDGRAPRRPARRCRGRPGRRGRRG